MYLGIDLGTSSVKTILMDSEQRVIESASVELTVQRPMDGWSEQDPESWWLATCQTLDQIAALNGAAMSQVKGIGLSGQMHGATLLDKNNKVMYPAILWNDMRVSQPCKYSSGTRIIMWCSFATEVRQEGRTRGFHRSTTY